MNETTPRVHTHSEPFTMTQEIRIPQARHRLQVGQQFYWQLYDATNTPVWFDGGTFDPREGTIELRRVVQSHLDPGTGDFWLRLVPPLETALHGRIVLTGILDDSVPATT